MRAEGQEQSKRKVCARVQETFSSEHVKHDMRSQRCGLCPRASSRSMSIIRNSSWDMLHRASQIRLALPKDQQPRPTLVLQRLVSKRQHPNQMDAVLDWLLKYSD